MTKAKQRVEVLVVVRVRSEDGHIVGTGTHTEATAYRELGDRRSIMGRNQRSLIAQGVTEQAMEFVQDHFKIHSTEG